MTRIARPYYPHQARSWLQAGAVAGMLLCAACQPKPVAKANGQAEKAASSSKTSSQVKTQPAPQDSAKAARQSDNDSAQNQEVAGGSASIVGGWADASQSCSSGAAVQFNADGTYVSEGETGDWAMVGKTLTVTTILVSDDVATSSQGTEQSQGPEQSEGDVGDKAVLTIESITRDSARVILSNGAKANWTRC